VAYLESMLTTTSITFPDDLLRDIDRVDKDRSAFLERAARRYLAELASAERSARDTADKDLYERHAEQLNAEAGDVLEFQSLPE
jgi:metal-responsive CopG/Arc/MetJ family transcriptional regulator